MPIPEYVSLYHICPSLLALGNYPWPHLSAIVEQEISRTIIPNQLVAQVRKGRLQEDPFNLSRIIKKKIKGTGGRLNYAKKETRFSDYEYGKIVLDMLPPE